MLLTKSWRTKPGEIYRKTRTELQSTPPLILKTQKHIKERKTVGIVGGVRDRVELSKYQHSTKLWFFLLSGTYVGTSVKIHLNGV